jgi:site-specific DNA recombinase
MITPGLRFAPLIRVSTELQEQQGESLKMQKTDLQADIKSVNGKIYKWYAGQEHATPDYERRIFDELISEAQQSKFDAVIVWSIDRWSRDNLVSEQGLKILRDKHIKFFVRTKEYDLFNPNEYFFIALYVLMGRTQSVEQSRKSVLNKIHRARQGYPTCGKLPYGRTYDKERGWGIDREKQKIIEDAARRYLEGESMATIAKSYNINHPNLNKILKLRSGDLWEQRFISKRCNIDEIVITKVPRLLTEETITKIRQRSEANKTFTHGHIKYRYLLSRMIFCEECGFAMFGQANHDGKLYYRHPRERGCKTFNSIPADVIEGTVIKDIFEMLGDRPKIDQAIKAAIPDLKELEGLKSQIEYSEKELLKNKKAKERLLDQVEKGNISDEDIKKRMLKLKEREDLLISQIWSFKIKYESIPSKSDITRRAGILQRLRENILKRRKHLDDEMTFEDKRNLLHYVFNGKDADNNRCGVYIRKIKNDQWFYAINGLFFDSRGTEKKIDIFDTLPKIYYYNDNPLYEPTYESSEDFGSIIDNSEEADARAVEARESHMQGTRGNSLKQDMHGQRDAHHRLGLHQR